MLLWDNENDQQAFERYLESQNIPVIRVPWIAGQPEIPLPSARTMGTAYGGRASEPITGATFPCGEPWPGKPAEEKVGDLSQRLAREQQTVQRLARLNDDLRRSAEKWQVRCYRGWFWPFACGGLLAWVICVFTRWWAR